MEDVLDLYAEPADPTRPVVCLDECPVPLRDDVRVPLPPAPKRPRRRDYEYRRCGTACLAVAFDPHRGWRHVIASERRTKLDFAGWLKALVDVHYPAAEVIRLVVDNLNTHTPAALYEAFPPAEAGRVRRKLEFHYTPVHGSWLNMAELEFSMLSRQCLNRRIGDRDTLITQVAAWEAARNEQHATIRWQFTVEDARRKLHRLYPS
jgi:DDE superfamily endonuclease